MIFMLIVGLMPAIAIDTDMSLTSRHPVQVDEYFLVNLKISPVFNTPYLTPPDFWSFQTTIDYDNEHFKYIGYFPYEDPFSGVINVVEQNDDLLINGYKIFLLRSYSFKFLATSYVSKGEFKLVNPSVFYGNVNTLVSYSGCFVEMVPEPCALILCAAGSCLCLRRRNV